MMARHTLALCGALILTAVQAQAWTYLAFDDGTFFGGSAASEDRFLSFACLGLSPQFTQQPGQEWFLTDPGIVRFRLSRYVLPITEPTETDAVIVVDGVSIDLPTLNADDGGAGYETLLPLDHPLFTALWEGANAVVEIDGTPIASISLDYAETAIPAMLDQCALID